MPRRHQTSGHRPPQRQEAPVTDLPAAVTSARGHGPKVDFGAEVIPIRDLQRRYAAWALERVGGRKSLACEKLGIDAKTLNKWLAAEHGNEE
jgi:two-component system response regulator HydG